MAGFAARGEIKDKGDCLMRRGGLTGLDPKRFVVERRVLDLQNRITTVKNYIPLVNVKEFGATGDGITDDSTSIERAMKAAADYKGGIFLPKGLYAGDIVVPVGNVAIVGGGKPRVNSGVTGLVGGTILLGKLNLNNKVGLTLCDFGVDQSASADDCIRSGTQASGVRTYTVVDNVVTLGTANNNGFHGLVLTSGSHNIISRFSAFKSSHGLAMRCSHSTALGLYIEDCLSSGVISKGASTSGDAILNIIDDVTLVGTSAYSCGPVIVEATENNNAYYSLISNIVGVNVTPQLVYIRQDPSYTGQCRYIIVSNAIGNGNGGSGSNGTFAVTDAEYILFDNCFSLNSSTYGFFASPASSEIYVKGGVVVNPTSGNYNGVFNTLDINGRANISAKAMFSTDTAIGNASWTSLTGLNTEKYDRGSFWTGTSGDRMTIQTPGEYRVFARLRWEPNATGLRGVRFQRSTDSAFVGETVINAVTGGVRTIVSSIWEQTFAAGDYILIDAYQSSGGPLNLEATETYFAIEKIGD